MVTRMRLVATLLRHELRQLLRDRRTVVFSILLPLAVMLALTLTVSAPSAFLAFGLHEQKEHAVEIAQGLAGQLDRTGIVETAFHQPASQGIDVQLQRLAFALNT